MLRGKRYWIVGASEGIGAALARALDARGARLILSARSADRLTALGRSLGRPATLLPLDVTDPARVAGAAQAVGEIDGVIYMAGAYWPMTARDWQPDRAEAMAEVNFTGALRVLGHVVPPMVTRGRGHVVIIGSLAGFAGLPGAIGYGASKAALMHLAENLRADLRGTGVRVQRLNPGFVDTRLTRKNGFRMPFLWTPERAAARIVRGMERRRFSHSFPFFFSMLFRLMGAVRVLRG